MAETTHELKSCSTCKQRLSRAAYSKAHWWRESASCKSCNQTPPAKFPAWRPAPATHKVQASGATLRTSNWGYCNYVDELFSKKCFPTIVGLGAFSSAKDVSESMACIHAARRHCGVDAAAEGVLCLCIGDGCTPRTALLACFLTKWRCVSIDPALNHASWIGKHRTVERLVGFGGTLDEFMQQPACKESWGAAAPREDGLPSVSQLVLLCVHSHARFIGPSALPSLLARFGHPRACVVTMPCCSGFRPERDLGRPADVRFDDECVFSDKRAIEIWKFELGATGVVAAAPGVDDDVAACVGCEAEGSAASERRSVKEVCDLPPDVQLLIAERAAARGLKEWSRADSIRDTLEARGFLAEGGFRSAAGWRHVQGLAAGDYVMYQATAPAGPTPQAEGILPPGVVVC